jgi:hypothetical protein
MNDQTSGLPANTESESDSTQCCSADAAHAKPLGEAAEALPGPLAAEVNGTPVPQPPLWPDLENPEQEEEEEEEEEDFKYDYDDEECREYIPAYMAKRLEQPSVPPGMTAEDFRVTFRSITEFKQPHRPKSDYEFEAVYRATVATLQLIWLDRQPRNLIQLNARPAVEALHLKVQALVPSSKKDTDDLKRHAKEGAMDYFTDPDYQKGFSSKLERGGFGEEAIATEAFQRAMPSLGMIERMRKSALKERDHALKQLEQAYSSRDPNAQMPLSSAALTHIFNEERLDRQLARQEREAELAKKAAQDGDA